MPPSKYNSYSQLGIGIGLRKAHHKYILAHKPEIEWFEIITENFLADGGRSQEVLDEILQNYKVVMHAVSLYFGSPEMPPKEHLNRIKALVRRTKTPWLTDHLCWGSVDGLYSHDLLPLPYTREVARMTADKIKKIRDFLEVQIAVENVSSYAEYTASQMSEWEFLNEVAEQADCGVLLDVNNIFVSSRNHNFDPQTYIDSINYSRVVQIHIAGHCEKERWIIDTHDRAPVAPVWELYGLALKRCGHTATLLEWDSKIPPFEQVYSEALKAKTWLDKLSACTPDTVHTLSQEGSL